MSGITLAANQTAASTILSFTLTGQSGTVGYSNITIQKSDVPYGTTPSIYIDNQPAENQSYTQDTNNYYLYYATHFSTHQMSIIFTTESSPSPTALPSQSSSPVSLTQAVYGIVAGVAIVIVIVVVLQLVVNREPRKKSVLL
jgi:hypothetical protein